MLVQEKNIKGFNVLELIVVLTIVGIISAVAYPNFSSWTKERQVRSGATKIQSFMKNIHSQIKLVEISIDAARKDTYENIVRLGGKWDVLMENLEFIKTIDSIEMVMLDFVVQKANFREMEDFVLMGQRIFGESEFKLQINFTKVWPWPSIKPETYKEMCVWDSTHPDYNEFVKEIRKIEQYDIVLHNLNEYSEHTSPLI